MNRYPLWKNLLIAFVLLLGAIYAAPNLFGEIPAVQITPARPGAPFDAQTLAARLEPKLTAAGLTPQGFLFEAGALRVRFADTETQIRAKDLIESELNPDPDKPEAIVALNLLPGTPQWLSRLGAKPMYLGLDLRGGVHFLLEVDMEGAVTKRLDAIVADLRSLMRAEKIRHLGIARNGKLIEARFADEGAAEAARRVIAKNVPDLAIDVQVQNEGVKLTARLTPAAEKTLREFALKQNITTLHNRINETM